MDKVRFNLNEHVWVKLLPKGFEVWKAFHDSFMPARLQKHLDYYQAQVDEQGYCKFQLWEFMQTFGPSISISTIGLFETNVLLDNKALSAYTPPQPTSPDTGEA